jgi:hypothetical protein
MIKRHKVLGLVEVIEVIDGQAVIRTAMGATNFVAEKKLLPVSEEEEKLFEEEKNVYRKS